MSDKKSLDAHFFICTNDRGPGQKESCGAKGSAILRDGLKKRCHERGWQGNVRINAAGCLGTCEEGITAVLYPKTQWFYKLTKDDVSLLEKVIEEELKK